MDFLFNLGRYYLLMRLVFKKPERFSIYLKQVMKEIDSLGINSLGIVTIISIFMGAVITIQTAFGIDESWTPAYLIGFATRDGVILEFSPTVISLILAGKVGSHIASEIGTMRVTEQIDALEIMGVNSAGYIILPKIIAAIFIFPLLIIISMFLGISGGWAFGMITDTITSADFIYGIQYDFNSFKITYALIKTVVFAFIITSVSSYYGYYAKGGALEVGRASTKAVVYSSIILLLFNLLLTQLLLG